MTGTERFPTAEDALAYRRDHDKRARALERMTKPTLRDIERQQLADAGMKRIMGGPVSKYELERAILDHEFPVALVNEATHVLYHEPGENWSACELCTGKETP